MTTPTALKNITVWVPGEAICPGAHVAPHTLQLPPGADRWEVFQDPTPLKPIQFIAVSPSGSIVEIHSYAHGTWSKWRGF